MKYIDSEKLIAEIEKKKKILVSKYNELAKHEVWRSANEDKIKINTISDILSLITSLQQERPLTIEKVVEQCKKFGGNPKVIQPEQKCIFGNTPSEDICLVCSAACPLRVPKTKVSTSTEIATSSGQVEELTFEEYLRGVFEINNGIENDPDNLVRIHAPELLKLARKQDQPEADLEEEFGRWIDKLDDKYCMSIKDYSMQDMKDTARHFYELGINARKEKSK